MGADQAGLWVELRFGTFSELHSCRYLRVSGGPDAGTSGSLDRYIDRDIVVTENLPDSQTEENN